MNISNALLTAQTHELLQRTGTLDEMSAIEPRPASDNVLRAVHSEEYLRQLENACDGGAWSADAAFVVPATWNAAVLAAGAAAVAAEVVLKGAVTNRAFVNSRPPGHHAERSRALGACYLNNVACAATHALALGAQRVMIIDWDVHIGNGAEAIFWDRDDVLAISIHQTGWYPRGAGLLESIGGKDAAGATVNVPLPPATTNDGYLRVLEEIVRPIARHYAPNLIIVAAGQDPAIFDPMGRMLVTADGFSSMTRTVVDIAEEAAEGRLICCLEGGYSHVYTPLCTLAVASGLLGREGPTLDPFEGDAEFDAALEPAGEPVRQVIEAVRRTHRRWF